MPACGGPKSGKKGKRMNETEIIQHPQIDGLRIFFDTVITARRMFMRNSN